jgi:hypothetical protein
MLDEQLERIEARMTASLSISRDMPTYGDPRKPLVPTLVKSRQIGPPTVF